MASSLGTAIGAVGGVGKYFEGRRMQKEAQKFIDSFEWQELKNAYENQQVSTLGADLQREELARMSGTSVDALRQSGTRGIVGGLGRIEQQNRDLNKQIASDLDQQQQQINWAISQDNAQLRNINEQRQANELQGYGQMMSTGMGMKYGGMSDVMNASMLAGLTIGGQNDNPQPMSPQPQGFNTQQNNGFGGAMGGGFSRLLQGLKIF